MIKMHLHNNIDFNLEDQGHILFTMVDFAGAHVPNNANLFYMEKFSTACCDLDPGWTRPNVGLVWDILTYYVIMEFKYPTLKLFSDTMLIDTNTAFAQ